jgi:hypothetical protein
MKNSTRPLNSLQPDDVKKNRLWEFVPSKDGELWVKSIASRKTKKFSGRLVSCQVTFANDSRHWALIEGIDIDTPEFSRHNREIRLFVEGCGWFHLAQYFDNEEIKKYRGESVLSEMMGLSVDEIFPIEFDVRELSSVDSSCLSGTFEVNPGWGLSKADVMALLVQELG